MASLTLKNLPEDLLRALREAAERDRRSLTQEIVHLLNSALRGRVERPVSGAGDVDAQLAAWRKLAGRWESDVDRATEVKQLMERRTSGHRSDADPDKKWQVEVLRSILSFMELKPGWDSYDAPPLSRDVGFFALQILDQVMSPRTPIPQAVPSSVGGVQLEWHDKGIDLELHIAAPYEAEFWFQDHSKPDQAPISMVLSNDFSTLRNALQELARR